MALPFWASNGFDERHARFFERLDWNGNPLPSVAYRALVQARQIYVFAHAAVIGWFPEGAKVAETGMVSLLRDFRFKSSKHTGFIFSVNRDSSINSEVFDTYTHAFVLFAIAWVYRLNGERHLLSIADEIIDFLDSCLQDNINQGLFSVFPVTDQDKRQNPHMHLLEAYLALEAVAPGRGYIERATKLVGIFKKYLFHVHHKVLLEYFAADWTPHTDPWKRNVFEPGHHFEWIWLLDQYAKLTGENFDFWCGPLNENARVHGVTKSGLIYDELDVEMRVLKSSHRVWPHTEAIKSSVSRFLAGDSEALNFAAQMVQSLTENFLGKPFDCGWIDHITSEKIPIVDFVPASSLYHIFLSAVELSRALSLKENRFKDHAE
jgi:mannose-6-phosphate isomerase